MNSRLVYNKVITYSFSHHQKAIGVQHFFWNFQYLSKMSTGWGILCRTNALNENCLWRTRSNFRTFGNGKGCSEKFIIFSNLSQNHYGILKIKTVELYSRILILWNRIILMATNKSQRSRWYNIKIIIPRYNCLIEFNAINYTVTTPEVLIHQIKLWFRINNW